MKVIDPNNIDKFINMNVLLRDMFGGVLDKEYIGIIKSDYKFEVKYSRHSNHGWEKDYCVIDIAPTDELFLINEDEIVGLLI